MFVFIVLTCLVVVKWSYSLVKHSSTFVTIQLNSSAFQLIHQPDECRDHLVAVIVTSAIKNKVRRDVIRRTWARGQAVYFLLGRTSDVKRQSVVDVEAGRYGDIVQGSFDDTYRNLTYKSLTGYLWARDNCNASYIVKVDDDCYVHLSNVRNYLHSLDKNVSIVCNMGHRWRVFRDRNSKWRVTKAEYPDAEYPDFCLGSLGTIFSHQALTLLLEQVPKTRFLWLEDVYNTGLLRLSAGLQLTALPPKTTVATLKQHKELGNKSNLLFGPTDIGTKHVRSLWKYYLNETIR